jgi:hypothetical protein
MRMIRHTAASLEANRPIIISQGIKMAYEITKNVNDEGYFVNAEDLIIKFSFACHYFGKCFT